MIADWRATRSVRLISIAPLPALGCAVAVPASTARAAASASSVSDLPRRRRVRRSGRSTSACRQCAGSCLTPKQSMTSTRAAVEPWPSQLPHLHTSAPDCSRHVSSCRAVPPSPRRIVGAAVALVVDPGRQPCRQRRCQRLAPSWHGLIIEPTLRRNTPAFPTCSPPDRAQPDAACRRAPRQASEAAADRRRHT